MDRYELFIDTVSEGEVTSPHVLDVSTWTTGCYQVVVRAYDRAGNYTESPAVSVCVDQTAPAISNIRAEHSGAGVLCPAVAVQGVVDIYVDVMDAGCADLLVPPTVAVAGFDTVTYVGVSADTYHYQVTVAPETANGTHQITVTATDGLANASTDASQSVCVNKNRVSGTVSYNTSSSSAYSVTRNVVLWPRPPTDRC